MSLYVVSDMHIWGADDPLYRSLLKLIRERSGSGDTWVLAGDIFDLFVGDKSVFADRYAEFFEALNAAAERGASVHYIEGNHDFLIGEAFRRRSGAQVHEADVSLAIGGKRFFVAHGDLANRRDYGYRFLRWFFRSLALRAFVRAAPGSWIDWIGRRSSQYSREAKATLPSSLPVTRMEALRRVYRSYAAEKVAEGYDYVVMGHCHDLDEMSFEVGGRPGQYVNVGFPRVHGSFLSWSAGDEKISREALPQ